MTINAKFSVLLFIHFYIIASPRPKWQHKDCTLKEKLDILHKLDCGVKAADICRTYDLSASTLSTWKKQRTKLKEMVEAGKVLDLK